MTVLRYKAGVFVYRETPRQFECWGVYDKVLLQWSGPVFNKHDAKRIALAKNWVHIKFMISTLFKRRSA